MNTQTADPIVDEWARLALGSSMPEEREERLNAMRRALIALVPEDPPDWTLTPAEQPQILMLGESVLWVIDDSADGVAICRIPIDPERMRLSVLEKTTEMPAAEGGHAIMALRTWTLADGDDSVVIAQSRHFSTQSLTLREHRDELFAQAVAARLGWTARAVGALSRER